MRIVIPFFFFLTTGQGALMAQPLGSPTVMPLVVDLAKVEIGAYADYVMSTGGISLEQRWGLVARDKKSTTLELVTNSPILAKSMTVRLLLPNDPTSKAKSGSRTVIQVGSDDPMLAPADYPEPKFVTPQRENLVAQEVITVAAGTFKTMHYRETGLSGTVDLWVSDTVPPIGLVKIINTPEADPSPGMTGITMTLELSRVGKGQKPGITKKPKPFDEKRLQGLVNTADAK